MIQDGTVADLPAGLFCESGVTAALGTGETVTGSLLDPDGYYALFDVDVAASHEQLTDAYRRQLRIWHPDHSDSPDAHERTLAIIAAGVVLLDPEKRHDYDQRARRAAGYTHEPPPPKNRPQGSDTATQPSSRSRLPVLYTATTQAVARVLPQWRRGIRMLCWSAIVGYALLLTDNVSQFNPGLYDLSDGLETIRDGGDGAPGAWRWLIFWSVMALVSIVMMFKTRFFGRGGRWTGVLTTIAVLPGIFVAVFSAIPIVLVAGILLFFVVMIGKAMGG